MLKELVASSSDHCNEGHKLLEVTLCIPIAVQGLHDFVHSLLVFDFLKRQKQAVKAGEDHPDSNMSPFLKCSLNLCSDTPQHLVTVPSLWWGHNLCPVPLGIATTAVLLGRDILSPHVREGNFPSVQPHPSLPCRLFPSSCCSV